MSGGRGSPGRGCSSCQGPKLRTERPDLRNNKGASVAGLERQRSNGGCRVRGARRSDMALFIFQNEFFGYWVKCRLGVGERGGGGETVRRRWPWSL